MSIFGKFFRWLLGKKPLASAADAPSFTTSGSLPLPAPCFCYTVSGTGGEMGPSYEVAYTNCSGNSITTHVNPNQVLKFCAKSGSVKTYASYTYTKCTPDCQVKIGPSVDAV